MIECRISPIDIVFYHPWHCSLKKKRKQKMIVGLLIFSSSSLSLILLFKMKLSTSFYDLGFLACCFFFSTLRLRLFFIKRIDQDWHCSHNSSSLSCPWGSLNQCYSLFLKSCRDSFDLRSIVNLLETIF